MQEKIDLSGIVVPTVTPFFLKNERFYIDTESQQRHLNLLCQYLLSIFLGSNAGESRQMDLPNLKTSLRSGLNYLINNYPHINRFVGVLRKSLDETVDLAKFAQDHGAQALVFSPLYTGVDIYQTRDNLLKNTSLPLVIYNNPDFQEKQNLPLDFIAESSKNNRIIGIKDTSRSIEYFNQILKLNSNSFRVLQGDTKAGLLPDLGKCDGMVAIESNIFPETLVTRWERNNIAGLQEVLTYYNDNKSNYGGSIGLTKHHLVKNGIFTNSFLYHQ